ncbi:glycoside hydrolase family 64 protein [Xylariaceae sp. AK1471]|nr:glycoside hydrolase family 64 protein [Xylariaceae sp. AK1471]
MLGFITQHQNDGSTTYYVPRDTPPGVAITASAKDLSWKVEAVGTSFKTPGTIVSGRLYIVNGALNFHAAADTTIVQPDPHNPSDIASQNIWGFVELTHSKDSNTGEEMVVNLSFVDWVSLPLGMNVTFQDHDGQKTVSIPGLNPDGLINVCKAVSDLDSFWPRLCLRAPDSTPLRVMSPAKYLSLYPDDKDVVNYYEPYITKVWDKYSGIDLQINTQANGPGVGSLKVDNGQIVTCRVKDDILQCDNEAGNFVRPVSKDIYGCDSGPFANPQQGATESWSRARVRPRLCAAFTRSTLLLDGVQPSQDISPDQYYKENITNHYSRVIHENLIGGMGYAFPYDDVNSNSSVNTAGLVSMTHPTKLEIFINT